MCNPAAVQPAEELHARSKGYLTRYSQYCIMSTRDARPGISCVQDSQPPVGWARDVSCYSFIKIAIKFLIHRMPSVKILHRMYNASNTVVNAENKCACVQERHARCMLVVSHAIAANT